MKVLLVGATGFVGRHLLGALSAAGHQVIATSRGHHLRSLPGVEWQVLDLDRLAEDSKHFILPHDIDLLINAAGLLSVDEQALRLTQDLGTRALFDLAARQGLRVLHISALGAGEQPDVPFLASKAAADDYLMALGVPAVVLRPSLLVGAGGASSAWLARLSPWPLIPLLDLQARLQPLHIDDLSAAVLALLRHWPAHSQVLPLVGPQVLTLAQVLDQLRAAQGWGPARYVKAPGILSRAGAWLGDRLGWRALNRQSLRMAQRDNVADHEALAELCGLGTLSECGLGHAGSATASAKTESLPNRNTGRASLGVTSPGKVWTGFFRSIWHTANFVKLGRCRLRSARPSCLRISSRGCHARSMPASQRLRCATRSVAARSLKP